MSKAATMNFQPNGLFFEMSKIFSEYYAKGERVIVGNEGSSRSSKTWDTFHFIVAFCDANRGNPQDIYILRDTLVNCRDSTLLDFKRLLGSFDDHEFGKCGLGIWNENNFVGNPKPVYKLWGHTIRFRGLDDSENEGYPSDVLFFNEVLEMQKEQVEGLIMRCRKLVIMDWNPRYTNHWVFDMEKQPSVVFTHSTYKNNRFLSKAIVKGIEAYNPAVPENVVNKTADAFRWKVYGLGERANKEGLVFPDVEWVDNFPEDIDSLSYGMDFGETAQTAITKIGLRKKEVGKHDLFVQGLFYNPTDNSDIVANIIKELQGTAEEPKEPIKHIWCDNNQPGWVRDLRAKGIIALCTKKFPGSREYWISTMKKFNLHFVKNVDLRKEQENFCYRVVDGIQLSETIKKHDHYLSSAGYATVGEFRIEK